METNESILSKGVVSINDRKLMGKIKDVIIDCDTFSVSHYIVTSASTNSPLVLPFEKSIAVGDTFMTIQTRDDFLPTTNVTARGALDDNFDLVGLEVYSKTGNHVGVIKAFDIDTTFGAVAAIELEDGTRFGTDSYVFFAPEFIFVDDGGKTAADLRANPEAAGAAGAAAGVEGSDIPLASPADDEPACVEPGDGDADEAACEGEAEGTCPEEAAAEEAPADEAAADEVCVEASPAEAGADAAPEAEAEEPAADKAEDAGADGASEDDGAEADGLDAAEDGEPAAEDAGLADDGAADAYADDEGELDIDPDAELKDFLLGKVLVEQVVSADGEFVAEKGMVLDAALLDDAQEHDALLLLVMSIDS